MADADHQARIATVPGRSNGGMMISTYRNDGGNNVLEEALWESSRLQQERQVGKFVIVPLLVQARGFLDIGLLGAYATSR